MGETYPFPRDLSSASWKTTSFTTCEVIILVNKLLSSLEMIGLMSSKSSSLLKWHSELLINLDWNSLGDMRAI